jgi:hypothetical protein
MSSRLVYDEVCLAAAMLDVRPTLVFRRSDPSGCRLDDLDLAFFRASTRSFSWLIIMSMLSALTHGRASFGLNTPTFMASPSVDAPLRGAGA